MFNDIGPLELVTLIVLAVLVFGPDKLPKLIQDVTRTIRKIREFSESAKQDIRQELGPEFKDLELRDLDPRTIVRKHIMEAMNEPDEPRPNARSSRPLREGEAPPYDLDAT